MKNELKKTVGPDLREAMRISDPAEAKAWLEGYVAWLMERDPTLDPKEAITVAVHNVCYHAAIYAHTQLAEVQETFGGRHPVYQVGAAALAPGERTEGTEGTKTTEAAETSAS